MCFPAGGDWYPVKHDVLRKHFREHGFAVDANDPYYMGKPSRETLAYLEEFRL